MSQGVVLVTGGSKRIGREICLRLSSKGYKVLVHYRNSHEDAEEINFLTLEISDKSP